MKDGRFLVGVGVSAAWLVVSLSVLWFASGQLAELKPNEWGDYLAGVFAPLAFFWLVLGYMQQGDELRLNTEALQLQAAELQNSVEQQRQLVEVSRLQVDAERAAIEFERSQREAALSPRIMLRGTGGSFSGGGPATYRVTLINIGPLVTGLRVWVIEPSGELVPLRELPFFAQGSHEDMNYRTNAAITAEGTRVSVHGTDAIGRGFEFQFPVLPPSGDPHTSLAFGPAVIGGEASGKACI